MTILEMIVNMDCDGCARKVKKTLRKLKGVDRNNIVIDMDLQKVTVTGWADPEKILRTIRKTGMKADRWPFPHNTPLFHNSQYFQDQYFYHSNPSYYFTSRHRPTYEHQHYEHGHGSINGRGNDHQYGHAYYDHEYDRRYQDHQARPSSSISDGRSINGLFSDENVHACFIM